MRLFLAVRVPRSVREDLVRCCHVVARDLPGARWVRGSNIHLTLVFLGEVGEASIDALLGEISAVTRRSPPFDLEVAEPGTFPPKRPARVAWIGLSDTSENLVALQAELSAACSRSLGRDLDDRAYHPHLTMARCKRPWPRGACERWRNGSFSAFGRRFGVTYVDLMRSRLTPSGPLYERLQRFPLEA